MRTPQLRRYVLRALVEQNYAQALLSLSSGRGFNSSTPTVSKRGHRGLCLAARITRRSHKTQFHRVLAPSTVDKASANRFDVSSIAARSTWRLRNMRHSDILKLHLKDNAVRAPATVQAWQEPTACVRRRDRVFRDLTNLSPTWAGSIPGGGTVRPTPGQGKSESPC